jgi:transcriptional regulator with XRE-family HTH domain
MANEPKALIGLRIRGIRKDRRLTQEQLAEKANVHPKYVSSLERGQENPTLEVLLKLAGALDVDISDFFAYEHEGKDEKAVRELISSMVEGADDEKLQLAAKILRAIFR